MSIWTAEELDQQIAAFKQGLLALAKAQSTKVGDTLYTRAELPQIRETLSYLQNEKEALAGSSGPRVVTARPRR